MPSQTWAKSVASTALERGTYRNHFHAVLADTAVVPRFVRTRVRHQML